jgi:GNAT superfamily N-acetyltransferase
MISTRIDSGKGPLPVTGAPASSFPVEPEWRDVLSDGTHVLIRPIRAGDAEIERKFIERLSPQSRRYRFLGEVAAPSAKMVDQFTHPDPVRDAAFVALIADGAEKREIGVSRFGSDADMLRCECAVVVADEWQGKGLAVILMRHLIETARARGLRTMYSLDAIDNQAMRDLAEHFGFDRRHDPDDATQVIHTLDLGAVAA